MSSDSLEWRQARQWLITSQVIPVTHKITKPDVDLVDFARSLRDGVFLCSLLNTLKPGCVANSDWNPKPLMQVSLMCNLLWIKVFSTSLWVALPAINFSLPIIWPRKRM